MWPHAARQGMSAAQATVYRDEYGNEYAATFIIGSGWTILCRPSLASAWSIYSGAFVGMPDRAQCLRALAELAESHRWQAIIPLA